MTSIALIRHGPTSWNEEKRLQGQTDVPLSPNGHTKVAQWSVPDEFTDYRWVASPMTRAMQTAEHLGLSVTAEPTIVEMHWGDWEGFTGDELREKYGDEFQRRAAQGLDLRPHGGESPRDVRTRVHGWIKNVATGGEKTGAVCHQGIIRAALSLATGWEMVGPPPHKMDWASVHLFSVTPDGDVSIDRLNISLLPE
jgi:probable phosphoglycerate mutase